MQTFNITSATTTTLREQYGQSGSVNSIRMTNTSQSTTVRISLFLEDSSSNKFYISTVDIPGLTTLMLDEQLGYSNATYSLKLTTTAGGLSTSTPLTVIVK